MRPNHPNTDEPWPDIPAALLALWEDVAAYPAPPECCLVNLYRGTAKMGAHQDRDEAATEAPVVSISLGDAALFRFGGTTRKGPTQSVTLSSGDVVMFGGPARLMFHGIDRVIPAELHARSGRRPDQPHPAPDHPNKMTPGWGANRAPDAPLRADAGRG